MCIEHADSIKIPLKETYSRTNVQGVTPSHLPWPADVWSCCTAAAVPAGTDGFPIHTSTQHHLWSRGDLSPAKRTGLKLSLLLEIGRWGSCLLFMGICASGIWTPSRCIMKGLCRGTAWWTQVSNWKYWDLYLISATFTGWTCDDKLRKK